MIETTDFFDPSTAFRAGPFDSGAPRSRQAKLRTGDTDFFATDAVLSAAEGGHREHGVLDRITNAAVGNLLFTNTYLQCITQLPKFLWVKGYTKTKLYEYYEFRIEISLYKTDVIKKLDENKKTNI